MKNTKTKKLKEIRTIFSKKTK